MNDLPAVIPMNDLDRMATAFAASGLFGAKTKEQALSLMLVAQAEGLHPAAAARDYDIIQGKGAKKAEAMMRDFLRAGGTVKWNALDDTQADATFSHGQGGTVRIKWDMDRVKKAKIANPAMYEKYPRQMLRSRCVSEGVRTVCPLATGGMYTPEDIQSIDPADAAAVEGQVTAKTIEMPQSKSAPAAAAPATPPPANSGSVAPDAAASQPMKPSQCKIISAKLKNCGLTQVDLDAAFPSKCLIPTDGKTMFAFSEFETVSEWIEKNRKG